MSAGFSAEVEKRSGPTDGSRTDKSLGWKVLLWNCSCHSFDDVEILLMRAIKVNREKAHAIAFAIHTTGKAAVYSGHKERCEVVASILQEGGLKVTLEK